MERNKNDFPHGEFKSLDEQFSKKIRVKAKEIINKNEDMTCEVNFGGTEQKGFIFGITSTGYYDIGLFKKI
jgi:hypothetical protein